NTTRAPQSFLNRLMVASLNVGCRCPGRSLRPTQRTDQVFALGRYMIMPRALVGRFANRKLVEAPWMRYALSAICAYVCGSRCSVAEGDSPNVVRYVTAKRPSSRNRWLRATSATLAVEGSARRSAQRALF